MAGFSAHALEPKQCVSTAELNAAMAAEHQSTIIVGNRMVLSYNAKGNITGSPRLAQLFTSDTNGNGYNLESDKPLGVSATVYCVRAKYVGAQFNDWKIPGVPAFALTPVKDREATRRYCLSNQNPGLACGTANDFLTNGDTRGKERVMMVAQTVSADGSYGRRLIVSGRAHDGGGAAYAADSDGTGLELFFAEKMAFTPKGDAVLAGLAAKN